MARPSTAPKAKASSNRSGPLIRLRPGDIVITEPNEWHWHGATSDRFMVHLSFTEGDAEWGDHLTDAEYPPPDAETTGGAWDSRHQPRCHAASGATA